MNIQLTVFFEAPFWVGVFERHNDTGYEVCKVVFGAEPKDYDIYDMIKNRFDCIRFSEPVDSDQICLRKINPKRQQREIRKAVSPSGVGTKAQEALKRQYEENKAQRKLQAKKNHEAEKQRQFELRQQKKKKKKKGH